jgi:hypothetical protein
MIRLRRAITILVAVLVSLLGLATVSATALAETSNSAELVVDEWIAPTSTTAFTSAPRGYAAPRVLSRVRSPDGGPRLAAKGGSGLRSRLADETGITSLE